VIERDPLDYGWWLVSRSAGIVALVAVTLSVILGLLMANGLPRRRGMKPKLLRAHEALALAGLFAIGVHGVTLLGSRFLHASVAEIAIPFTLSYRPAFTGIGILAGYLAAVLGLSFYVRKRVGAKLWRKLHRWTVAVWALGVVHTLGAGTDATTTWLRAIMLGGALPIAVLFARRMLPSAAPAGARAARPAPASDQGLTSASSR
jgi:sulfoxide reductase heme-binding subunit YedZ